MLDPDACLKRITLDELPPPGPALLQAVVGRQATATPFEKLDIVLGRIPGQRGDSGMAGESRRGGYCFKQNTLLRAALDALGFHVSNHAVRMVQGSPSGVNHLRTHMFPHVALPQRRVWPISALAN